MDPIVNWDEMLSLKPGEAMPQPGDEDLAYYLEEYKDFDNLFDEALTTLQDLDVPSGYGQAPAPPQRGSIRMHNRLLSQFRHAKKPSGTAIFGFLDHNREFSLGGAPGEDVSRATLKPAQDPVMSISPTQLARLPHAAISSAQLDFNFEEPYESCKPIELKEEDEERDSKREEDIIVTNTNPKSYKFPPAPPEPNRETFEQFLGQSRPLQPIHHPKRREEYPDHIDGLRIEPSPLRRYVPIPVHEPLPAPRQQTPPIAYQSKAYTRAEHTQNSPHFMPLNEGPGQAQGALGMNMNVFLPPPSASLLSQASPEPHSPLQHLSSPLRRRELELSPITCKRAIYPTQFFSDGPGQYYGQPQEQGRPYDLSPIRDPQLSPLQAPRAAENHADDTLDANETILQLTPLKNHAPITPKTNRITLEWSPVISPNGKATKDVRKAIQELSPKRMMKKTSLLPPGELDKYWQGPDDEKNFTCMYHNCGKKFTRRYNVRSHIQTHLSDRPFTCAYCPKSFVRQHDLNRHVKSHMGSKHCRCKCGREFTRIEGYKKHLANGVCLRAHEENHGAVSKPSNNRIKGEAILDGLTSNRLHEELDLAR